jgi:hypothetical protein
MPKIERLNNVPFDLTQDNFIFSIDPGKENFACRLEKRLSNGEIEPLIFVKIALSENALTDITTFLNNNEENLSKTNIMIVERQMPINYRMVRVSQHCETYFLTKYRNVSLLEISPKLKAEKKLTFTTALQILEQGKDFKSKELLEVMKKQKLKIDDLCDTICQIHATIEELKILKTVPNGPSCFKKVSVKKKRINKNGK